MSAPAQSHSSHSSSAKSGVVGIVIAAIAVLMLCIGYAVAGPPVLAPVVPEPLPAPTAVVPVPMMGAPCCEPVAMVPAIVPCCLPEKKLLTQNVQGYTVPVRCIGNVNIGGFTVQSTDDVQSQAAGNWLTLELAKIRSQNYDRTLCHADKWNTPPKEIVRTVTKTVAVPVAVHVSAPPFYYDRWVGYDSVYARGLYYRYYNNGWVRYYP